MGKRFNKIICSAVAVVAVAGIMASSGCAPVSPLPDYKSEGVVRAEDNGGFLVEKGDYIYFVNGNAANTDASTDAAVKGSIMRLSKSDFAARNYANTDVVVPSVIYSGNHDAGIFIYGDYVYYSTPSTQRRSDGSILNNQLEFKSTKLDGTDTKDAYITMEDLSTQYRYVSVDDTVYLMYTASEQLYEESSAVTNLHSYNTESGVDTLLAYNVSNVTFDCDVKQNPRVYYTMNVRNYATDSDYPYNQVYTVTADATQNKFSDSDFDNVLGWVSEDDDPANVDHYINCGELVFDGIGRVDGADTAATVFNYDPTGATRNELSYNYRPVAYTHGTLFYTRTTPNNSSAYLFMTTDATVDASGYNPVTGNPDNETRMLNNGSSASSYKWLFNDDGTFKGVLYAGSAGGLVINNAVEEDGVVKLGSDIQASENASYFHILREGTVQVLFIDGDFVYYSANATNGYTINRVNYTGSWGDYDGMPVDDTVVDFTPVKVLDIETASDWYLPEFVDNQLVFASETNDIATFGYIMVCDLRNADGSAMNNAQIKKYNEKYQAITDKIEEYTDTENYPSDKYANLHDAYTYAFYSGESEYIKDLAKILNEAALAENKDANPVYSDTTLEMFADFLKAEGDWAEYAEDIRKINGEDVHGNMRDYYYCQIGYMSEADAEAYLAGLRSSYLRPEPEPEPAWWDTLEPATRNWIIVGIVIGSVVVAAGIVVLVIFLVKRNKKSAAAPGKKRIKVDTTDDKNIDVYATDDESSENKE